LIGVREGVGREVFGALPLAEPSRPEVPCRYRECKNLGALDISYQALLYFENLIDEIIKNVRGPGHMFVGPCEARKIIDAIQKMQ
jgi:hypothetical protein